TTEIYTLSLHDALPIWPVPPERDPGPAPRWRPVPACVRTWCPSCNEGSSPPEHLLLSAPKPARKHRVAGVSGHCWQTKKASDDKRAVTLQWLAFDLDSAALAQVADHVP